MALRAVSTLHTPKEFKLSRDERLTGFLPLYEARYREHVSLVINSLVLQGFLPMARNDRFLAGVKRQVLNEVLTALVGDLRSRANKSILRPSSDPKKPGYDFEFELVPASTGMLLLTKKGQITFLSSCGIKMSMAEEDNYQEVDTVGLVLTGEDVRNNCVSLGPVLRNSLASSLKSMSVDSEGTITVTMHLTKREVEFMTSTPLIAVRPGNLYALLSLWVASTLGNTTRMPVASMSITHISKAVTAASAGKDVAARNKNNSIVVLEEGGLAYIPDVDQSAQYEQALHDFGIQEDGSYCFSPPREAQTEYKIGQESTGKKLPINMPILTDWVNLKFAYSNTEGRLAVLDLDRSVKLRPTHVRRFLELNMMAGKGAAFLSKMALLLQVFGIKIAPTAEQLSQYNTSVSDVNALVALPLVDYVAKIGSLTVNLRLSEELSVEDDLKLTLIREDSVVAPFRAVAEAFKQLQAAIEGNFDKAYRAVSVLSFIELFAGLRLINAYAKDFDKVVQIDVDQRSVYIKQGVDPEHTPEPLPFMRKGSFMLPHQKKTENLMRGNPAFAIYSIDAGGGKTMLVLTNVLKELKQGHCKRPIILCPGHLVQGYIKDAVYFTEGKVNMIPITAYSIRQNGYERIQEMIKRAPPNTIFVSDYDFLKRSKERIAYGVRPVFVFRNVEFLRQFKFDLVAADESHYLKNDSTRSEAAQRFMAEIPRKRLCSGTIVTDTPMDIVAQASIMDPSIFGSRGDFALSYAQEMKGEKVMVWKEGAGRNIRSQLQEHVVWVDCRRKEWATLLPDPDETFHAVDLTPNQMACYQSLLEKTMDDIKNAAAKDPKLKAALDAAEDENVFDSLAALLKPYLSRLESFLAAPAKDKLGQELLTEPSDRMSPKVAKIIDLCRTHLGTGIKGKILIFTNHIAVAEEIYNSFPPDLKKQAIHYIAAEKLECGAAFEGDDRKTIMVGVEKSMNTGLNLQFASRLIRIETVWTPGEMEQGNSRINRPELKKEDVRDKIYLDWIVCNKTFDITKVSRLVSKMIQKAKFDEPHNPEFQALTEPPMMAMTLNNIIAQNDFAQELAPYLEAYQDYKQVLYTDYRNYREAHKDEMEPTPWVRSENLAGSKLMARTPYIPDMALYGSDQLGLLRYDEYMRIDPDDLETEDEGEDEGDDEDEADDNSSRGSAQRQANRAELAKVEGLGVHTEFGDGTIIGCGKIRLKIRLANGDVVRPRKLACYVITRRDTSTKDIRKQLLKMAGEIPVDTPIEVPATSVKSGSRRDRKAVEDTEPPVTTSVQVELYLTIVNDFLALGVQDTEDQTAVGALSKFGFRLIPEHYTALIRTPQALLKLYKAWSVAGLKMYRGPTMRAKELYEKVKNKSKMNIVGLATKLSLRNFLLMEYKASGDTNIIKPYPMLRDGMLYVGLPKRNQAGTAAAIRVAVPTVKWVVAEPEMLRFVVSKQEVVEVIKSLMAAGIEVTNLDELGKVWKKIRVVRNPEAETEDSDE